MTSDEYRELTEFLGRQFTAIDQRFDGVDRRLDGIDQRFDGVDRRFDAIDQRFDGVDRRLDTLDQRADAVDRRLGSSDRQFVSFAERFDAMDRRFDRLEGDLRDFREEMLGHFDSVYQRLDRLEQEYVAITQGLRRIEAFLADERGRREIIEESVAELKRQVAVLQARIEQIEGRLRQ